MGSRPHAENRVVLEKFVQYAHEQGYIPTGRL
jgi:hypothetical protein